MDKIIIFAKVISLIVIGVLFASCQPSEKNKWTPPKFVKEWEIKEIKHGLPHHIISMTTNMNQHQTRRHLEVFTPQRGFEFTRWNMNGGII